MAGIQVSGLVANSAFDWKSVVDQLIKADSIPIDNIKAEQTKNTDKISALVDVKNALLDLQDSVQNIRANNVFSSRNVSTDTANTTWKSSSSAGAALGTYAFDVTQIATQARLSGAGDIGAALNASNDVSALTIANMRTATPVSAGVFTVNGQQVNIATTDTLQGVFDAIYTATGGDVTGTYDSSTDKVTLTSASGDVLLGAGNDTSNFLSVFKLANNGTGLVSSSDKLGTVKQNATLANSGLSGLTGAGSFKINGVSFSYDPSSDTLGGIINRINTAGVGVTASYDSANDRMTIFNNSTGDTGLGVSDTTGTLLASLGLTSGSGAAFSRGKNALFTVNGGNQLVSASNTLESSVTGISGFSVTVNTQTKQTLQVQSDTSTMQTAIQSVVDKFNTLQSLINDKTKITITGSNVSGSVLTNNHEVEAWGNRLQQLAFESVSGLTGSVQHIDDLGIDFNGIAGQLTIKNPDKLATALSDHPDDVSDFFLKSNTGFVAKFYSYLTTSIGEDSTQQTNLTKSNSALDTQIATMQSRIDNEREQLTNSFIAMLDAQSAANSANTTITNAFLKNNSSS